MPETKEKDRQSASHHKAEQDKQAALVRYITEQAQRDAATEARYQRLSALIDNEILPSIIKDMASANECSITGREPNLWVEMPVRICILTYREHDIENLARLLSAKLASVSDLQYTSDTNRPVTVFNNDSLFLRMSATTKFRSDDLLGARLAAAKEQGINKTIGFYVQKFYDQILVLIELNPSISKIPLYEFNIDSSSLQDLTCNPVIAAISRNLIIRLNDRLTDHSFDIIREVYKIKGIKEKRMMLSLRIVPKLTATPEPVQQTTPAGGPEAPIKSESRLRQFMGVVRSARTMIGDVLSTEHSPRTPAYRR